MPTAAPGRNAPVAIRVLLPVWGAEFIARFFDYSLPTLLAPGNLPALARTLPTRFVFLTRASDAPTFRNHRAFHRLAELVGVEFSPIDELITQGNHSTTITLAYARAVRACGPAMLDTCFFFLVSDYIMADGSLAAVLARMLAGASAVQTGNFQLIEERAEGWLQERFAQDDTAVALTSRELVRWGLGCLHPITLASTINFPLTHNTEANRLLWRIDDTTLIGRFYLLHMICIRPEVSEFAIGASCDYSFVPEMCPSGNIATITDSDDYLVVEIQPRWHEDRFIRPGAGSAAELAKSLSVWTTAQHRANAEQTMIFHAGDLPPILPAATAEADRFIAEIGRSLRSPPQPHRDHPYWRGAIAAFTAALAAGTDQAAASPVSAAVPWFRHKAFGLVPGVTRAHPRWRDMRAPLAAWTALRDAEPQPRLLVAANRGTALTTWVRGHFPQSVFVSLRRLQRNRSVPGAEVGGFDVCIMEFVDDDFFESRDFLRVVVPLMRAGGQILLVSLNDRWLSGAERFGERLAVNAVELSHPDVWLAEAKIVTAGRLRWLINGACVQLLADLLYRHRVALPLQLLAATILLPMCVAANLVEARSAGPASGGVVSSAFLRFQVVGAAIDERTAASAPQGVEGLAAGVMVPDGIVGQCEAAAAPVGGVLRAG